MPIIKIYGCKISDLFKKQKNGNCSISARSCRQYVQKVLDSPGNTTSGTLANAVQVAIDGGSPAQQPVCTVRQKKAASLLRQPLLLCRTPT
jgi:zona occludens toxin (predicted ATPase)